MRTVSGKILITNKCTMTRTLKKWREKGESLRVDRYRCIEGRCLHQIMSAKTKVKKRTSAIHVASHVLPALSSNVDAPIGATAAVQNT